jgi:hypothetical protein
LLGRSGNSGTPPPATVRTDYSAWANQGKQEEETLIPCEEAS